MRGDLPDRECSPVEFAILAIVNENATREEIVLVKEHLSGCGKCRAFRKNAYRRAGKPIPKPKTRKEKKMPLRVEEGKTIQGTILEYLQENPVKDLAEIAEATGLQRDSVGATLSNLFKSGEVDRDETVSPYRYWVADFEYEIDPSDPDVELPDIELLSMGEETATYLERIVQKYEKQEQELKQARLDLDELRQTLQETREELGTVRQELQKRTENWFTNWAKAKLGEESKAS